MIKPRNLKFVHELISASVVIESFFNYVDLDFYFFCLRKTQLSQLLKIY